MSKFDDIKVPDNIDEVTKNAISMGIKYKSQKKYRKIIVASIASITIGISVVGIGVLNPAIADSIPMIQKIIDYFKLNNESLYKSDKSDLEKTGTDVNLTTEDKEIELTIDSISIDDNYMTIFHTVKTDKDIKKIDKVYEDAYVANPIVSAYIGDENITPSGFVEHEARYISDHELKGMRKIDVSGIDIKNNTEIELRVDEIFGIEGNWSVFTNIDKTKSESKTYNYNINKDFIVNQTYDYNNKKIDIKHNINIEKVTISPLANKITVNEKPTIKFDDWTPMMGNSFALFDENNQALDVIDQGGSGVNPKTGIATNSIEFLKANKNTKSLILVPIAFDESIEDYELEPQSINNLPIVFETSKYGKLVVEDIKVTDKEIRYTYYKDGVVPYYTNLWFYDEEGNEIQVSSSVKESLDRHTGRYTTIRKLEGYDNDISSIRKISKVSIFNDSSMKLLYDQQIKIDLKNNQK